MRKPLLALGAIVLAGGIFTLAANRELAGAAPELRNAIREQTGWTVRFADPVLAFNWGVAVRLADLDAREEAPAGRSWVTAARVDVGLSLVSLFAGTFPARAVRIAAPVIVAAREGDRRDDIEVRMAELDVILRHAVPARGGAPEGPPRRVSLEVEATALRLSGLPAGEELLAAATGFHGLAAQLPKSFRERHPALFGRAPIDLDRLRCPIEVSDEKATLADCTLSGVDYDLRASGTVSPERGADLDALLVASEALTREIVHKAPLARPLVNAENRLQVRFFVRGPLDRMRIEPDATPLARLLAEALGAAEGVPSNRRSRKDALRRGLTDLLRR